MKIEIIFTEELLGTISGNKEIMAEFIASKNPNGIDEEEIEAVPQDEKLEKCTTIFARHEGIPILWDYHMKGYFKEACETMIYTETHTQKELKDIRLTKYMYKKTIDKLIFVKPRKIPLILPNDNKELTFCERPLRGMTMRGERIALARSEQAPAGTKIICEIVTLNKKLLPYIKTWLDLGILLGHGQWRNSGKGRFTWKEL